MIWIALAIGAAGVFLSAFYSGSETGFYRATRVRLVLDAMGGDRISRMLVWLTSNPSLFVATTLVGNNLANYLTSLAIVVATQSLVSGPGHAPELIAPLLLAPLLFLYGELLPKSIFMRAPNRLLRRGGPLLAVSLVLFFPLSVLLWGLSKILEKLAGHSPERVQLVLARTGLSRVLDEGHEVGILHEAQRGLARGIFAVANVPVEKAAEPMQHLPRARAAASKRELLRLAARYRIPVVPVESPQSSSELAGYVRVIDLGLTESDEVGPLTPLLDIPHDTSHLAALVQMQNAGESLARIVDSQGQAIGVVTASRLREQLFHVGGARGE
jgi:putative hemolysin